MSRQQTVSRQQQTQKWITDGTGVAFSGGVMHVHGVAQLPDHVDKWRSSNGLTEYTTVAWRDPATGELRPSCNCPAWTMKKKGKERECKHTKDMLGIAACNAERIYESRPIATLAEAVREIPKLDARVLRDIILD
jgi:hypothetical protein